MSSRRAVRSLVAASTATLALALSTATPPAFAGITPDPQRWESVATGHRGALAARPVPISGDSDTGAWTRGVPLVTSAGSALTGRYDTAPTMCARGDIRAKTGTLADVVALSGVSTGVDGRERLFSVLVHGVTSTNAARDDVDALAATSTGCY